jgi:hypothetical protein
MNHFPVFALSVGGSNAKLMIAGTENGAPKHLGQTRKI